MGDVEETLKMTNIWETGMPYACLYSAAEFCIVLINNDLPFT